MKERKKGTKMIVSNINWDIPKKSEAKPPKKFVIYINEENKNLLERENGIPKNLRRYLAKEIGYKIKGFAVKVVQE